MHHLHQEFPFSLLQNSATASSTWLWLQKLGQTHMLKDGHRMASDYLGLLPKGRNRNNQENVLPIQETISSSTDKLTRYRKVKIRNPWSHYPSNKKMFVVLGQGTPLMEVRKCLGRAAQTQVFLCTCQHPEALQFISVNAKTSGIQQDTICSQ